jgi:hypothetical protein
MDLRVDLRATMGFDGLYELPSGRSGGFSAGGFGQGFGDGVGRGQRYARVDGGLVAVFPQTGLTPGEPFPMVPAGTVYYIGALPPRLRQALAPQPPAVNRVNLSASRPSRPNKAAAGMTTVQGEPSASILTDEAFRRRRVAHLLRKAANAGKKSGRR